MNTQDEIALEDHRYFRARLDHLEVCQPAMLLSLLENGALTKHLREVVMRAMQSKATLVIHQGLAEDQADEIVMQRIIADTSEQIIPMQHPSSRRKLELLLQVYRAALPSLGKTYLSQSETIA